MLSFCFCALTSLQRPTQNTFEFNLFFHSYFLLLKMRKLITSRNFHDSKDCQFFNFHLHGFSFFFLNFYSWNLENQRWKHLYIKIPQNSSRRNYISLNWMGQKLAIKRLLRLEEHGTEIKYIERSKRSKLNHLANEFSPNNFHNFNEHSLF